MINDNEVFDKIFNSIKSMTTNEYNELYESIKESEDVCVLSNNFRISVSIDSPRYINNMYLKYVMMSPVQVEYIDKPETMAYSSAKAA